jgi:hypothetical protein
VHAEHAERVLCKRGASAPGAEKAVLIAMGRGRQSRDDDDAESESESESGEAD